MKLNLNRESLRKNAQKKDNNPLNRWNKERDKKKTSLDKWIKYEWSDGCIEDEEMNNLDVNINIGD